MTPAEMQDFLARFLDEVWNRSDLASIDRYIAPAYTIRRDSGDPWDGRTLDRALYRERLQVSRAPFPDQRFVIEEIIAEPERAAIAWRWSATHLGDLPGFPASGKTISMTGMTIYYIADGLLTGHWQEVDRLGVFRQLASQG